VKPAPGWLGNLEARSMQDLHRTETASAGLIRESRIIDRASAGGIPLGVVVWVGLCAACLGATNWISPNAQWNTLGPPQGTLLIDGGNDHGGAMDTFLSLAGGPEAPIVVIPTAGADENYGPDAPAAVLLRKRGAKNVRVLHTRERTVANSPEFAAPLKAARGVWISGGKQGHLAKAYLHTLVHRELFGVLERGGIVAGTSAGASIQGSYLYGGHSGGDIGFGFVRDSAIGQHYIRRQRHLPATSGLVKIVGRDPGLLGIGIDEDTFILVRGDVFEVRGSSKVAVCDARQPGWPKKEAHAFLFEGDKYDLKKRLILPGKSQATASQWKDAGKNWREPAAQWKTVGPAKGTLLLSGAQTTPAIVKRFLELAGGGAARIVVIPTADAMHRKQTNADVAMLRRFGAANLELLHTTDRREANSTAFAEPLRKAQAVWICGGEQWRLADSYLHTLVHKELFGLLERGGIVAGSGSGARFLAQHMPGDPNGWSQGCGFLRQSSVHTWLSKKRLTDEVVAVLKPQPALLGIGLDEKTAVVVQGDQLEVLGEGKAAMFDATCAGWPWEGDEAFLLLGPGERYDLKTRQPAW
jgi:cyanophycinase